ncbi:DUF6036 family nucleotidyltransferase [Bdellovibrionota bacterium FG-1]
MDVHTTLNQFDEYLAQRGQAFEAVVIGGAALIVMGIISRDTIDVDCLDPKIPDEILKHAANFRTSAPNLRLHEKWINNGPDSLIRDLPHDWRTRLVPIFKGESLHLLTLGRLDLLKTKLFAFCDRDQDLQDCMAFKPTQKELDSCIDWVSQRDGNPNWPENVRRHFEILKKRLGHDQT